MEKLIAQNDGTPIQRRMINLEEFGVPGVPVLGFDLPRTFAEIEAALVN